MHPRTHWRAEIKHTKNLFLVFDFFVNSRRKFKNWTKANTSDPKAKDPEDVVRAWNRDEKAVSLGLLDITSREKYHPATEPATTC